MSSINFTVNVLTGTPLVTAMEDLYELAVHLRVVFIEGKLRRESTTQNDKLVRVFRKGYGVLFHPADPEFVRWYRREPDGHWTLVVRQPGWVIDPDTTQEVELEDAWKSI